MKYEITKEQLRSLTDPKVKEMFPEAFTEPTFDYLEEVEVSDYEDFSISRTMIYVCNKPKWGYLCYSKIKKQANDYAYIKKLKQLTSLKN